MPLDFPSSPSNGQIYTDATTGNRYTWINAYSYWSYTAANIAGGSNTNVLFNDSGTANGTAGLTFNKTSNNLVVGNTVNAFSYNTGATGTGTGGVLANTSIILIGNNTVNSTLTSSGLAVNGTATIANSTGVYTGVVNGSSHTSGATGTGTGGFSANTTTILIGNNTINTSITSAGLNVNGVVIANNITLNANGIVINSTGGYFTGLVNSTSFNAGATGTGTGGTVQNTTTMFLGNNTINTVITSAGLTVSGTATIANSSGVYTTGTVNAASHTAGATGTGTGGSIQNTTTIFVGNNTTNTVITASGLTVNGTAVIANNSGLWTTGTVNASTVQVGTSVVANSSRLVIGTAVGIQANGSIGTATQILSSNGTTVYWSDAPVSNAVYMKGGAATIGTLAAGGSNIFRVNANTLNYNTTISAGENAQATGPLAVASGITLTVDLGARVSIV